ncbi:MAG: 30S ribosomal protein S20 [Patescibacteria group bacterium]|jgi:small subunit ribosomal protein S20
MPNITSAKKKLRQDKKKRVLNSAYKKKYREAVTAFVAKGTKELLQKAFSLVDKSVKKGILHKNTAARLKSKLGKRVKGKNG